MRKWVLGKVSSEQDHFQVTSGEDPVVRALIGNRDDVIAVQINEIGSPEKFVEELSAELDFYLGELNKKKPWKYLIYHSGTAANVYSSVHFTFISGDPPVIAPDDLVDLPEPG